MRASRAPSRPLYRRAKSAHARRGYGDAAYAFGAQKGYIYTRCEFYDEIAWLETAVEAYEAGYLGKNILARDFV